jgi:hypothetical protein
LNDFENMLSTSTKIELIFTRHLLWRSNGINNGFSIIANLHLNIHEWYFSTIRRHLLEHKFVKYFPIDENVVEVIVLDVPCFQSLLDHRLTNIDVSKLGLGQDTWKRNEDLSERDWK